MKRVSAAAAAAAVVGAVVLLLRAVVPVVGLRWSLPSQEEHRLPDVRRNSRRSETVVSWALRAIEKVGPAAPP